MMKVSDPVIFGHAIRAFFPRTFARFGQDLARLGVSADHGLGSIFAKIEGTTTQPFVPRSHLS